VTYDDRTTGIVSYASKSITQFYGVSGVTDTISDKSVVGINTFATVVLDDETVVTVRIVNVLSGYHVGEQVGWVKGKPYYGPYHIHRGRKMVGAKHVSSPHDYIYDTKESSLKNLGEDSASTSGTGGSSSSISASASIVSSTSFSSGGGGSSSSSGGGSGGYGY